MRDVTPGSHYFPLVRFDHIPINKGGVGGSILYSIYIFPTSRKLFTSFLSPNTNKSKINLTSFFIALGNKQCCGFASCFSLWCGSGSYLSLLCGSGTYQSLFLDLDPPMLQNDPLGFHLCKSASESGSCFSLWSGCEPYPAFYFDVEADPYPVSQKDADLDPHLSG